MAKEMDDAKLEGVRIIFRNFAGAERPMNAKGKRNCSIVLPLDTAEAMQADGWNVKIRPPRDEEGDALIHLPVKINFAGRPPAIYLITSRGRTRLTEDTVEILDYADIANVDVIVHPYPYDVNGSQGISAYVKTMFVTINEDDLEKKYADVADVPDGTPPWDPEDQ